MVGFSGSRRWGAVAVCGLAVSLLAGCRSAYVDADVRNQTGGPIQVLEVDYPSASFGRSNVAAGAEFHYRFKILGSGDMKAIWTGAGGDHTVQGPALHEGQKGRVVLTLKPATAEWHAELTN